MNEMAYVQFGAGIRHIFMHAFVSICEHACACVLCMCVAHVCCACVYVRA